MAYACRVGCGTQLQSALSVAQHTGEHVARSPRTSAGKRTAVHAVLDPAKEVREEGVQRAAVGLVRHEHAQRHERGDLRTVIFGSAAPSDGSTQRTTSMRKATMDGPHAPLMARPHVAFLQAGDTKF